MIRYYLCRSLQLMPTSCVVLRNLMTLPVLSEYYMYLPPREAANIHNMCPKRLLPPRLVYISIGN